MAECEHKKIETASEIELYEEFGLSIAEIHQREWWTCEDCGELLYKKGEQYIPHRRKEQPQQAGGP